MTIPRWRLALTAGALVVLGAVGGGLVQAAAALADPERRPPAPMPPRRRIPTARSSSTPSR